MSRVPPKSCKDCRHYNDPDEVGTGQCRRYPPTDNGWPPTTDSDWCGEFNSTILPPENQTQSEFTPYKAAETL